MISFLLRHQKIKRLLVPLFLPLCSALSGFLRMSLGEWARASQGGGREGCYGSRSEDRGLGHFSAICGVLFERMVQFDSDYSVGETLSFFLPRYVSPLSGKGHANSGGGREGWTGVG